MRWPGAFVAATLAFAYIYYVTPDVDQRAFRWITPGAIVGVLSWLLVSIGLSTYLSSIDDVGALYGTFTAAIVLVGWLWLTNVALLFGAELNAEIEREKQLSEGVPAAQTLDRPDAGVTVIAGLCARFAEVGVPPRVPGYAAERQHSQEVFTDEGACQARVRCGGGCGADRCRHGRGGWGRRQHPRASSRATRRTRSSSRRPATERSGPTINERQQTIVYRLRYASARRGRAAGAHPLRRTAAERRHQRLPLHEPRQRARRHAGLPGSARHRHGHDPCRPT